LDLLVLVTNKGTLCVSHPCRLCVVGRGFCLLGAVAFEVLPDMEGGLERTPCLI